MPALTGGKPGLKEPLGPLPAGVLRAAASGGGPAGQVGAASLAAAVGLDFLRMAARLKCVPSAALILGAGETRREAE